MCGVVVMSLHKEIWKTVVGWEGLYEVSNLGRVRSIPRKVKRSNHYLLLNSKVLSLGTDRKGYKRVNLWSYNKYVTRLVHSLVLQAFVGPCPNGQQARHGPNGPSDNRLSQLSYGNQSDNEQDKRRDGTYYRTPVVRSDGKTYKGPKEAADDIKGSHGNIVMCCQGSRKTHKGYGWSYA